MKKVLFILGAFFMLFSCFANAETISQDRIVSKNQIGSLFEVKTEQGAFLTDDENTILAGPFDFISNYGGYPYAFHKEGSKTLFDRDGTVLATVEKGGEAFYPVNGIYGVSPYDDNTETINVFEIYDYETKVKLFTAERFFVYYLEQQNEKMFIEKDGKYALIDRYGNYLTDFIYDDVVKRFNPDYSPFPKAYAIVIRDGQEKYIDWDLQEIDLDNYNGEPFVTNFKRMEEPFSNIACLESGNKHALYNFDNGEMIFQFKTGIEYLSLNEKYIVIKKDDKCGIIDYAGNIILDNVYESLRLVENGLVNYTIVQNDKVFCGFADPDRGKIVSSVSGMPVENGIMLNHYTDYSSGYKKYCSEIINYAGHNLTGEIYGIATYENGEFHVADFPTDNPETIVNVPRDFAIIMQNGSYLPFDGVVQNGRTLAPMREIIENLGGTVEWDDEKLAVYAVVDGKDIFIQLGTNDMIVEGKKVYLDVPAQLINDKTMLPVRALAESLGLMVDWDGRIRCVYIDKDK